MEPLNRIPRGWRVYAIGDVHGRLDLLDALLGRIETDSAQRKTLQIAYVFLGDYIDRGLASAGVIERLISLKQHRRVICLKGNHEAFLLEFLLKPNSLREWSRYGGLYTLMSYGLRPPVQPTDAECPKIALALAEAIPPSHVLFLSQLPLSLTIGDFFFVHAGVRPRISLAQQREDDLLWIREEFLLYENAFEKMIVHGHTPVREPEVFLNRINIDTGAYATGRLTCLVLEDTERRFL